MLKKELIIALFFILEQATCLNVYSKRRCEARLRTEAGWMCGRVRVAVDGRPFASFLGVPYGDPPLGFKRFSELDPVKPWGEHIMMDATEEAPACPQTDFTYARMALQLNGMSEDCIYLSLYVPFCYLPKFSWIGNKHPLPILVYLHGGIFQSGAGLPDIFGPEYLMTEDVIVITINYRINFFGFFTLNSREIPGNQGLRDIVTCLRWVQRNARAFGGDPNNVTLMGHSAGATAAQILSLSKVTKGLFHRLILMSCTAFPSYFTTSSEYAKTVGGMFLSLLGINETDPVLIHRELTKVPLLKLMDANTELQFKTGLTSFNLIIESIHKNVTAVLIENPLTSIMKGIGSELAQIVSFTDNEMAFGKWTFYKKGFIPLLQQNPTMIVSPRLVYTLPEEQVREIAERLGQRYYNGTPSIEGVTKCFNDMFFKYPAFKMAQWRAAAGGAPIYMYQFSYEPAYSVVKAAHWLEYRGAAHMDDLFCIFRVNSLLGDVCFPPKEKDVLMKISMVFDFSNPTGVNTLVWPPISKGKKVQYNLISEPMRVHMMEPTPEEADMITFFDSFDPESRMITAYLKSHKGYCC